MTRGRILTLVLGAALLLVALVPWLLPPERLVAVSLPAPIRGEAQAPPATLDPPALTNYVATVERPLFTATRRAAPASVAAPERNTNLVLGRYRLTGVIVTPARRSILLAGTGRTQAVAQGEVIDGWTLKQVDRDRIVLENGGRQEVVPVGKPETGRAAR